MSSNNLKVKKKIKFKKLKKFQKLKKINRKKFPASELCKEANFVKTLSGIQDIFNYRLCDQQIYSRSYTHDHDVPKMRKFTQVREQYLGYLQTVIKNNCAYYGSPVTDDLLDSLSLKLEQHALLSSFQIDVYENFLTKIIDDIEKCTKERQIHNEVKKLLPGSEEAVVCNKFNANSPESENSLGTITISDSSNDNLNENEIILANQSVFNSDGLDQCPSDSQQYFEPCTVPQDSDELSSLSDIRTNDDYDTESNDHLNFTRKEPEGTIRTNDDSNPASHDNSSCERKEPEGIIRVNDDCVPTPHDNSNLAIKESEGTVRANDEYDPASNDNSNLANKEAEALQSNEAENLQASPSIGEIHSPSRNENDISNKNEDLNSIPFFSEKFVSNETFDTFDECSKVIEKCMEQIFNLDEISDEFLESARAHIIQLLEDENFHGEDECAGNEKRNGVDREKEAQPGSENERNFAKRLEKMRPLFKIDERKPKRQILTDSKKSKNPKASKDKEAERQLRRLTAWKNEKIIQQYKVSTLTSQLTYEKRGETAKLFIELFGHDSDEEHEFEHGSSDQFKTSCIERISSWVVKHLTPFYVKRRIIGREVFKSLGRRISQTIIDKIQYPDERTVKYFVHKFFPPNKRYGFKSKRKNG